LHIAVGIRSGLNVQAFDSWNGDCSTQIAMSRNQTSAPAPPVEVITDPIESARAAGLRYVSDDKPGIRRRRRGKGFIYLDPEGRVIHDAAILQRIRALVIPPAWEDVWICTSPNGHIQVTARDAKGRKQYRYHPRWREVRDATKYGRLLEFARVLPKLRRRVKTDLRRPNMPREKILATIVRLLETTFIRIGNEEYARTNKSFGLTTMRTRHVNVTGSTLKFRFRGKSGKLHSITLTDPKVAKIIKRCQDLPGQELFQYIDGAGEMQTITSADVNQYLREITAQDFTAKDFRTWAGTVLAACALVEYEIVESEAEAKKNMVAAIAAVAAQLGNTPAVCRKCYVHPSVLEAYLERELPDSLKQHNGHRQAHQSTILRPEEKAVMKFLEQRTNPKKRKLRNNK
jgi:DNA topoisomerase-1